jgi:hypothetical protein
MLARIFKTAGELGIPENEYNALCTVLYLAEDGQIPPERIYMPSIHCGTKHCLLGWCQVVDKTTFPEFGEMLLSQRWLPTELQKLFAFSGFDRHRPGSKAIADLRRYLETGMCRA